MKDGWKILQVFYKYTLKIYSIVIEIFLELFLLTF